MNTPDDVKTGPQQCKDDTESSSKCSPIPQSCSPESSATTSDDSYLFLKSCSHESCSDDCTDCNNKEGYRKMYRTVWTEQKRREKTATLPKSRRSGKNSRKILVSKSQSELVENYCPYSSDNCGCSSGCTDCDYGLYTYTTKNKSKLKSKDKKLYVRSSNNFRSLKMSEINRRTAKSFNRINKLGKRDLKPHITRNRRLKTKMTSVGNSRKLKTTGTLKLLGRKKVSKKTTIKVSERDVMKNWLLNLSSCYEYKSDYTDCGEHPAESVTTKRKKLRNRSERARASTNLRASKSPLVIDQSIEDTKVSKQLARVHPERRASWSSCDYPESDSHFTSEDCCNNRCRNIRQSRRKKT